MAVGTSQDFHSQAEVRTAVHPFDLSIDKRLEFFDPIENSLKLHPGFFSDMRFVWSQYQIPDVGQDAPVLFSLAFFSNDLSLNFRSIFSQSKCRLFSGLWEMWKNLGCRQRGFSKRLWKSVSASDFHKRVIFHQVSVSTMFTHKFC